MEPLPLDDPRWQAYQGGYRVPFDASIPLRQLLEDGPSEDLWKLLWNELHHQGDVDCASYAAAPWLVAFLSSSSRLDSNALGLIVVIELKRPSNPDVPVELEAAYFSAIRVLPALIGQHPDTKWDEPTLQTAVSCIALARGHRELAEAYLKLDRDAPARFMRWEYGEEPDEG